MPDTNPQDTLDTDASEVRRNRLKAVWLDWRAGAPVPRWQDHLPEEDEPCSPDLIFELLQQDIECRIQAGMPALLAEPYFEHPRLQQEDALLDCERQAQLIRVEYQLRWNQRDQARRAEYEVAFPQHAQALRSLKPNSLCPRCRKILVLEETMQTLVCPDCDSVLAIIHGGSPPFVAEMQPVVASLTELDLRRYELNEALGKGGMGEVYRCCDPALGRDLAIKVMKAEFHNHPGVERRFLREARITGSLQHPGIIAVHNLGRLADGRLHYTMRLLREGRTFAEILKELAGKPERMPSLLPIFEKACEAMAYAHSKHVIHRDLKPANIMVGKFGEVQVMDWGLAKLLTAEGESAVEELNVAEGTTLVYTETADTPSDLTKAGAVIGTPPYMPPEQAQSDWKLVDERSDVFALGSILCEMLTGKPAYCGKNTNEVFRRAKRGDLAEALQRLGNCGADAKLIHLCLECLSYEREGRPRDAGVVARLVHVYEAEVQERLRKAEFERVEAEARAREEQTRLEAEEARTRDALARLAVERRSRRRQLVLSGAVVLTIATAFVLVRLKADQANEAKNQALASKELAELNEQLAEEKSSLAENAHEIAVKSQRVAEMQARKAQTVAKYLGGIFEASDPLGLSSQSIIFPHASGEKLSGQDLLERGAAKCERELGKEPQLEAVVLLAIGNAYVNLGEYKKGKPLLEKALRLAKQGEINPQDQATITHCLGSLYHAQGDYETAEKLYRSALKSREDAKPLHKLLVADTKLLVADTLFNLGWLLTEKEEHAEAEKCFQRCLDIRLKMLGKNDRLTAFAQVGLAAVYLDEGDNYLRVFSLVTQVIDTFKKLKIGEGQPSVEKAMELFLEGISLVHSSARMPLMNVFGVNTREQGVKLLEKCLRLVKESPVGKDHIYVAFVSGTLALELWRTGEADRAKPYFEECLKIIEDRVGLWHPKMDKVAVGYAALLIHQQKKQEADRFYRRVLAAREERFGKDHLQVANALVGYALIRNLSDPDQEKLCLRARRIYEKAQPLKGAMSIQKHAACLIQLGAIALYVRRNPVEAESILSTTWDKFRNNTSIPPVDLAMLRNNLAMALVEQTRYKEAQSLLEDARRICEKHEPFGQAVLKTTFNNFATMYFRQHRLAEVASLSRERRKKWPADPEQLFIAGRHFIECVPLVGQGRAELTPGEQQLRQDYLNQGIGSCQKAVEFYRKTGEQKHLSYKFCLTWLARGFYHSQSYRQAEKLVEESLNLCRKDLGDHHPEIAYLLNFRAIIRMAQRRYEGVEQNLREAEKILVSISAEQARLLGIVISNERRLTLDLFVQIYTSMERPPADFASLAEDMVSQRKAKLGANAPDTLSCQLRWAGVLAETYERAGQFAKAEAIFRDQLEQARRQFGSEDPRTAGQMATLGSNMLQQHKYTDAEPLLRDCLKIREAKQADSWATFNAHSLLGAALQGQKKYAEAEPLLVKGYEGMETRQSKMPPQAQVRLTEALERLVQLYDSMSNKDKADRWRKKLDETKAARVKAKP